MADFLLFYGYTAKNAHGSNRNGRSGNVFCILCPIGDISEEEGGGIHVDAYVFGKQNLDVSEDGSGVDRNVLRDICTAKITSDRAEYSA